MNFNANRSASFIATRRRTGCPESLLTSAPPLPLPLPPHPSRASSGAGERCQCVRKPYAFVLAVLPLSGTERIT